MDNEVFEKDKVYIDEIKTVPKRDIGFKFSKETIERLSGFIDEDKKILEDNKKILESRGVLI